MKRLHAIAAFALISLAGFACCAHAQKGGGGSTPAGTIYYSDYALLQNPFVGWYESFVGSYSMKADGTNKLLKPNFPIGGEPSRQVPGSRWTMVSELSADTTPYYPNGFQREP